jgi:hypothetical protein
VADRRAGARGIGRAARPPHAPLHPQAPARPGRKAMPGAMTSVGRRRLTRPRRRGPVRAPRPPCSTLMGMAGAIFGLSGDAIRSRESCEHRAMAPDRGARTPWAPWTAALD